MKNRIITKSDLYLGLAFTAAFVVGTFAWISAAFPGENPEAHSPKEEAVESPQDNIDISVVFDDIAFLVDFLRKFGNVGTQKILASGSLEPPVCIELQEMDAGGLEYIKLIWVSHPEK